jgi:hypothetical protein
MQHDLKGRRSGCDRRCLWDRAKRFATAFIEAGALLCDLGAKTRPSHFETLDRY